jgi:ADP-ribosylglycohydrolase
VLAMAEGNPRQAAIYAAALSEDADTVGAMAKSLYNLAIKNQKG